MKFDKEFILYVSVAVVVIVISLIWMFAQWQECQDMSFSNFYCLQHIL